MAFGYRGHSSYLIAHPIGGMGDGVTYGAALIPGPLGRDLLVIFSSPGDEPDEAQWEHVSVSMPKKVPTWAEMCFVKDLFWEPEDTVMQLHPAKSRYINNHPNCLHLWRPIGVAIPVPETILVGVQM